MKNGAITFIGIAVAILVAGGVGYRFGSAGSAPQSHAESTQSGTEAPKAEKKLLYYRNPMGLPDTSPTPKKDPMGMDYIPVYAGEQDDEPSSANQIKISTDKVQKLGVRVESAQLRALDRNVRAAGRIEPDERRVFSISPKFEGYVERLHVNVTGQPVSKGQALFEVYSPELVSAQREYAIAVQGVDSLKGADSTTQSGMKQLADSSLARLRNWDISEEQVKALTKAGESKRTLTMRSPVSGIVTEKKAVQGMRFMPGDSLYQVTDLSSVWVIADVFEQDIGWVKTGAKAKVKINAYPDKEFSGTVTYVYPTMKAETRTVSVRVELANPGLMLKPSMFAQVELPVPAKGQAVTVPLSAVIDSGTRSIVLVQLKEGRFEPREVRLGQRSESYVEVLDGVKDGESVVVAANFLIDAESNLKAAVGGLGHSGHGSAAKPDGAAPAGAQSTTGGAASGHKAEGTVAEIDAKAGTVSINHGPVPSLKWPAMQMEFQVANATLLKALQVGSTVAFEFVERKPGEWVITSITPKSSAKDAAAPAAHAGH
ncbi:MAG: efflux RND transporter periplasmic adaptor subunit [Rhodoferax sp.]|jgi:Cu(I)/Ag(I) efflux system membrane fusion protein